MKVLRWMRRLFADDIAGRSAYGDLVEEHRSLTEAGLGARVRFWLRAVRFSIEYGLWARLRGGRRAAESPRRPATSGGSHFSLLDFKLGVRMLVRYPGLTIMGGLAMALGIAFGAGIFEFASQWSSPDLRADDADRWVGVVVESTETRERELRTLHDLVAWRDGLRSLEELGAFRLAGRNLAVGEGPGRPTRVAEISASAFRITGTAPALGRPLLDEDERLGADPVVVIGHDLWQERFGADPAVVGRVVRLGGVPTTVVGVMPEGYEFPHSQRLWAPLQLDAFDHPPGEGPEIFMFGRLAEGATLERAQAEVATMGVVARAPDAPRRELLRPRVTPYPELVYMPVPGFFNPAFVEMNTFTLLLLVLLCSNVALLLFARAASREAELVVRNALGAGRSRIVAQLFAEALVLAVVAAVAGLVGARYGYEWFLTVVEAAEGPQPFWFQPRISPLTAFYVVGLAIVSAGIAGIVPALKVTRGIAKSLREATGGGGGLRFGGVWTLVIVAQIAVTLQLPPFAYLAVNEMVQLGAASVDIPADRYLTARLEKERDLETASPNALTDARARQASSDTAFLARYASTLQELERRLLDQAEVTGVTFADRVPLGYHPNHEVELAGGMVEPPDDRGQRVGRANVEVDYFGELGVEIVSGRDFDSEDVVSGALVAIVDEPFVERVLGGRSPLGDLVRYTAIEGSPPPDPDAPWYEIVGVVGDLGIETGFGRGGVYHPVARGAVYPARLIASLRTDPATFGPRLRELAAEVDPALQIDALMSLADVPRAEQGLYAWGVSAVTLLTAVGIMLSLAGIYSVMSFTVTRRTREIGVRVALGARARRLLPSVFRRPLTQIALGLMGGLVLLIWLANWLYGGLTFPQYVLAAAYAAGMAVVCMLACVIPTRKALGVEPIEALNVEG